VVLVLLSPSTLPPRENIGQQRNRRQPADRDERDSRGLSLLATQAISDEQPNSDA